MTANIDFARMLYDAFRSGRIDTIIGHCTDTIRWECVGNPVHVPHAGLFNGRNGVGRFFDNLARVYIFDLFSPDRFHACGEHVFCFGHATARSTATNKAVDNRFIHTFTIKGGRLAEFTEFTDTAAIAVGAGTLR